MRRYVGILTILLFFIWILPLGAFIRPDQEKKACNGQRGICLCSHAKARVKASGKILLTKSTGAPHKEENGSGGGNQYFLTALDSLKNIGPNTTFLREAASFYTCLFFHSLEHVPKT